MSKAIASLVASKVMGWPFVKTLKNGNAIHEHPEYGHTTVGTLDAKGNFTAPWDPTTPAAMMAVVEKMREGGCSASITISQGGFPALHTCQFAGRSWGFGAGDTLMLAVCLAALRACAVPESDIAKALEER